MDLLGFISDWLVTWWLLSNLSHILNLRIFTEVESSSESSIWRLENVHLLSFVSDWLVAWWFASWLFMHFHLIIMEWLTLHDNVLAQILVAIHASSEELVVWDARNTETVMFRAEA